MEIKTNENLKPYSWWQTGGLAEFFCQPESVSDLKKAVLWAKKNNKPWTVLGAGTNVLISDRGVKGLLISTKKMHSYLVEKDKDTLLITCQAGVLKSEVMKVFKQHKLAPAIFLSGLPGDVSAGVVMNAGVGKSLKPHEFSQIVHSIKVMNEEGITKTYLKRNIEWLYRESKGWGKSVIYEVKLQWALKEEPDINSQIKEEIKKRRKTQPLEQASCGSVFKNPQSKQVGNGFEDLRVQFAAYLIEQAGLKGAKKGLAQISTKHANFIVNLGGATSKDIHHLICLARKRVHQLFQIQLETEVHYLGDWSKEDPLKT